MGKSKFIFIMIFLFKVFCFSGGLDIGGGNALIPKPITTNEIEQLVNNFHDHRRDLVTAIQLIGISSQRLLNIRMKLKVPLSEDEEKQFSFQAEILKRLLTQELVDRKLPWLALEFNENLPCLDNENKPKDASVRSDKPTVICISTFRIKEHLNSSNFEFELLGLYLHELLHTLGGNEDDGIAIQEQIRELGVRYKAYFPFLFSTKDTLKEELKKILEDVKTVNPESSGIEDLCPSLSKINLSVFQLFQEQAAKTLGVSVLGTKGTIAFHSAFVISGYLQDFCEPHQAYRQLIKFGDNRVLPIKELYPDPLLILLPLGSDSVIKFSSYLLADLGDFKIYLNLPGNREFLNLNLKELRNSLERAIEQNSIH